MSRAPLPVAAARAVPRRQRLLDGFAVTASLLCLIHCLMLPLLLIAVPVLATMLTIPESFHAVAFAIAVPTSLLALAAGHARHRRRMPALLTVVALALLGIGAFAIERETAERIVTSLGAVLLAVAHLLNWRSAPRCPVARGAAHDGA